jgi:hypothetical protein
MFPGIDFYLFPRGKLPFFTLDLVVFKLLEIAFQKYNLVHYKFTYLSPAIAECCPILGILLLLSIFPGKLCHMRQM